MIDVESAIFTRLSTDTAAAGALDAEAIRYLTERGIPTAGYDGSLLSGGVVTILAAARAERGLEEIDAALLAALGDDPDNLPGGEIYREGSVPQEATYPRVQYMHVSGVPGYVYAGQSSERVVALIKAVDHSFSSATVNLLWKRIEVLFNVGRGVSIAAGDFTIKRTQRAMLVEHTEDFDDQRYQHLGGEYEMLVT